MTQTTVQMLSATAVASARRTTRSFHALREASLATGLRFVVVYGRPRPAIVGGIVRLLVTDVHPPHWGMRRVSLVDLPAARGHRALGVGAVRVVPASWEPLGCDEGAPPWGDSLRVRSEWFPWAANACAKRPGVMVTLAQSRRLPGLPLARLP